MGKNLDIQSVMTTCPHTVGLDQNIEVARKMMRDYGFRHLPVLDGGRLVGVISDRDIKFAVGWAGSDTTARTFQVKDVFTPEPYIVQPTTSLQTVLRKMVEDQIGCALVAVDDDKLVGLFTTTDACRCLADSLADASG